MQCIRGETGIADGLANFITLSRRAISIDFASTGSHGFRLDRAPLVGFSKTHLASFHRGPAGRGRLHVGDAVVEGSMRVVLW